MQKAELQKHVIYISEMLSYTLFLLTISFDICPLSLLIFTADMVCLLFLFADFTPVFGIPISTFKWPPGGLVSDKMKIVLFKIGGNLMGLFQPTEL